MSEEVPSYTSSTQGSATDIPVNTPSRQIPDSLLNLEADQYCEWGEVRVSLQETPHWACYSCVESKGKDIFKDVIMQDRVLNCRLCQRVRLNAPTHTPVALFPPLPNDATREDVDKRKQDLVKFDNHVDLVRARVQENMRNELERKKRLADARKADEKKANSMRKRLSDSAKSSCKTQ